MGELLRIELAALATCFAAVVVWKLWRGTVQWLRGPDTRGALRLQMLGASLAVAAYYLARLPSAAGTGSLPPVPAYALAVLAGSQAAFLVPAVGRLLRPLGSLRNEEGK